MKNYLSFLFVAMLFAHTITAQDTDRKIQFPDIDGYLSLKADLHIHTVFSDGSVWPNIRVEEALWDGLDAIAITEHLEYQNHKDDLPNPDRNRAYYIARDNAKAHDLIVIPGAEITRSLPTGPGHCNALFIEDANKLLVEESIDVFEEAKRQGAFVMWNHPDWVAHRPDGVARMNDFNKDLISKGLIHGIEVVNDITYSEETIDIAKEYGLTQIGASDVHGLVDYQFRIASGNHRPITLIFAKEKTAESMKEALFAGRTVAWFNNNLIGEEEWLKAICNASLSFEYDDYIGPTTILQVKVTNISDVDFILNNTSKYSFQRNARIIEIPAHSEKTLLVRTLESLSTVDLQFEILNAVTGKDEYLTLDVPVAKKK
ncbi:Sb-PDE family phosphodiesterase [Portibacter lacus]|uniref:Histidinol-phosphatase n=1 Tax=Portibacter lacus TaxID=1099794 RepID=A0AA37SLQ6_9BACT|nr:Sb-PDE family phosphodiesterase [Portibacter lacus]GLR15667.1 histidinol-phosphatase [Portibacter lacus]